MKTQPFSLSKAAFCSQDIPHNFFAPFCKVSGVLVALKLKLLYRWASGLPLLPTAGPRESQEACWSSSPLTGQVRLFTEWTCWVSVK